MSSNALVKKYQKLPPLSKRTLQLFALSPVETSQYCVAELVRETGLQDGNGRLVTKKATMEAAKSLASNRLAKELYKGYLIDERLRDYVIRSAMDDGLFAELAELGDRECKRCYRSDVSEHCKFLTAFYQNDPPKFRACFADHVAGRFSPLCPFDSDIYANLSDDQRQIYFACQIPRWIAGQGIESAAIEALDQFLQGEPALSEECLPAVFEWAIAKGDLTLLRRVDQVSGGKRQDVAGCLALLEGDLETAAKLLAKTISSKGAKKYLATAGRLPSLLMFLLVIRDPKTLPLETARKAITFLVDRDLSPYPTVAKILSAGFDFLHAPSQGTKFRKEINQLAQLPIDRLVEGYLCKWLIAEADQPIVVKGLAEAISTFESAGCDWLAAEAAVLGGYSDLQSADDLQQKGQQVHDRLGTTTLVEGVEAEPLWERTLNAIASLGGTKQKSARGETADSEPTDRLIFELHFSSSDLDPHAFQQVRKGKTWSKGRKVGNQRLHDEHDLAKFAFLTEQDQKLCRTLRSWSDRGGYGYMEDYCEFQTIPAARALIGHPRVFKPGDRNTPLDIIEAPVRLIVKQESAKQISLQLNPTPKSDEEMLIKQNGPHQIAITFFDNSHFQLQQLLGGKLLVPAKAASKVIKSVQSIVSLVTVHSELEQPVGSANPAEPAVATAKSIPGIAIPNVHVLPTGDGIRIEFYVRPFGDAGPFVRPGEGGGQLYANIDDQPMTASRAFDVERKTAEAVIASCPDTMARLESAWSAVCPTPIEALESLLELEPLADANQIVLHWPKGKSLQTAGQAGETQLRVNIKRDRDWFAASGELQLDKQTSIDMMQLIKLLDTANGRFVQLDDGRFLALTEQLRQRIEDLRSYGQSTPKGTLRFPGTHATLLSEMGDVKLNTDTHFKKWVKRLRDSESLEPDVPSTLTTELRDYQQEGFAWMARLAAWGVGGCLADDMGLGKTVQAIAVLLHRAADGPALIVAPTSVIYNWQSELQRFAPTLQPHVFGEADRQQLLDDLQPRDVVLCSYGLLQSLLDSAPKMVWTTLVLDEAQAIKNFATQRSQAAKSLAADFRLILTGTPMENHLGELWNLMDFINPGLLGTADSFQDRFAIPIERDHCRDTRGRLKRLVSPFILRRTKTQVLLELPSRTEVELSVQWTDEEAAFYEALRHRAIERLADVDDGKSKHLQVLAEITRLRRACCHPKLVVDDCGIDGAKLQLFSKTIDELIDNQHKVLVFSQFVDHLSILRDELDRKKIAYQYLDGSTTAKQRKTRVEAFQAGQGDVFLISLKAGGTGLNLTAADYVIHMDPWWNPAVEDQASDRAHRLGQQRPVTIYRMITRNSIEERILELHATKRDLADSLLEGTDRSGKMTTDELLKLLRG